MVSQYLVGKMIDFRLLKFARPANATGADAGVDVDESLGIRSETATEIQSMPEEAHCAT